MYTYQKTVNKQFEIWHVDGEHVSAEETLQIVSEALPGITGYFRISDPFPIVRVILVPNREEFDRFVRDFLHVEIEIPSNPARMAQPQRTDMVVLSPSAYAIHCSFEFVADDYQRLLAHELVHIVEEYLSPDIESTPRWWSEGLAVYLSDQWHKEKCFFEPVVFGTKNNRIPSFSQIENEVRMAYDWGWTIVRFLEYSYGREMIRRMVKENTEGKILSVVGEDLDILEARWRKWLQMESFQCSF